MREDRPTGIANRHPEQPGNPCQWAQSKTARNWSEFRAVWIANCSTLLAHVAKLVNAAACQAASWQIAGSSPAVGTKRV